MRALEAAGSVVSLALLVGIGVAIAYGWWLA